MWQKIALILLEFTQMCSVAAKTTQGKKMLRLLPCAALADFEEIRKKGFVYVDKARFIETMERLPCGVV